MNIYAVFLGSLVQGRKRFLLVLGMVAFIASQAMAAPEKKLIPYWEKHDETSQAKIDHTAWQTFLDQYLVSDSASGIHLVRYRKAKQDQAEENLSKYISQLQSTSISEYNRSQQKAFWINLYNAATVRLILQNYPIDSITDVKFGFFSFGPWDEKLLKVEGKKLSLNDIEHGILRPVWNDERIHYAVNCASLGCPNLASQAYTAENTDQQLEQGAKEYIHHPRGFRWDGEDIVLSKIYKWYGVDFGSDEREILNYLKPYLPTADQTRLERFKGDIDYEYDWALNQVVH